MQNITSDKDKYMQLLDEVLGEKEAFDNIIKSNLQTSYKADTDHYMGLLDEVIKEATQASKVSEPKITSPDYTRKAGIELLPSHKSTIEASKDIVNLGKLGLTPPPSQKPLYETQLKTQMGVPEIQMPALEEQLAQLTFQPQEEVYPESTIKAIGKHIVNSLGETISGLGKGLWDIFGIPVSVFLTEYYAKTGRGEKAEEYLRDFAVKMYKLTSSLITAGTYIPRLAGSLGYGIAKPINFLINSEVRNKVKEEGWFQYALDSINEAMEFTDLGKYLGKLGGMTEEEIKQRNEIIDGIVGLLFAPINIPMEIKQMLLVAQVEQKFGKNSNEAFLCREINAALDIAFLAAIAFGGGSEGVKKSAKRMFKKAYVKAGEIMEEAIAKNEGKLAQYEEMLKKEPEKAEEYQKIINELQNTIIRQKYLKEFIGKLQKVAKNDIPPKVVAEDFVEVLRKGDTIENKAYKIAMGLLRKRNKNRYDLIWAEVKKLIKEKEKAEIIAEEMPKLEEVKKPTKEVLEKPTEKVLKEVPEEELKEKLKEVPQEITKEKAKELPTTEEIAIKEEKLKKTPTPEKLKTIEEVGKKNITEVIDGKSEPSTKPIFKKIKDTVEANKNAAEHIDEITFKGNVNKTYNKLWKAYKKLFKTEVNKNKIENFKIVLENFQKDVEATKKELSDNLMKEAIKKVEEGKAKSIENKEAYEISIRKAVAETLEKKKVVEKGIKEDYEKFIQIDYGGELSKRATMIKNLKKAMRKKEFLNIEDLCIIYELAEMFGFKGFVLPNGLTYPIDLMYSKIRLINKEELQKAKIPTAPKTGEYVSGVTTKVVWTEPTKYNIDTIEKLPIVKELRELKDKYEQTTGDVKLQIEKELNDRLEKAIAKVKPKKLLSRDEMYSLEDTKTIENVFVLIDRYNKLAEGKPAKIVIKEKAKKKTGKGIEKQAKETTEKVEAVATLDDIFGKSGVAPELQDQGFTRIPVGEWAGVEEVITAQEAIQCISKLMEKDLGTEGQYSLFRQVYGSKEVRITNSTEFTKDIKALEDKEDAEIFYKYDENSDNVNIILRSKKSAIKYTIKPKAEAEVQMAGAGEISAHLFSMGKNVEYDEATLAALISEVLGRYPELTGQLETALASYDKKANIIKIAKYLNHIDWSLPRIFGMTHELFHSIISKDIDIKDPTLDKAIKELKKLKKEKKAEITDKFKEFLEDILENSEEFKKQYENADKMLNKTAETMTESAEEILSNVAVFDLLYPELFKDPKYKILQDIKNKYPKLKDITNEIREINDFYKLNSNEALLNKMKGEMMVETIRYIISGKVAKSKIPIQTELPKNMVAKLKTLFLDLASQLRETYGDISPVIAAVEDFIYSPASYYVFEKMLGDIIEMYKKADVQPGNVSVYLLFKYITENNKINKILIQEYKEKIEGLEKQKQGKSSLEKRAIDSQIKEYRELMEGLEEGHDVYPYGITAAKAEELMRDLIAKDPNVEKVANEVMRRLRAFAEKEVIPVLRNSGMFSDTLMNYIEKNICYIHRLALRELPVYVEGLAKGKEEIKASGKIFDVKGHYGPIAEPVLSTLQHWLYLITATKYNNIAKTIAENIGSERTRGKFLKIGLKQLSSITGWSEDVVRLVKEMEQKGFRPEIIDKMLKKIPEKERRQIYKEYYKNFILEGGEKFEDVRMRLIEDLNRPVEDITKLEDIDTIIDNLSEKEFKLLQLRRGQPLRENVYRRIGYTSSAQPVKVPENMSPIQYVVKGKVHYLILQKELANILLNGIAHYPYMEIFGRLANLWRHTQISFSPRFMIANPPKDITSAYLNTPVSLFSLTKYLVKYYPLVWKYIRESITDEQFEKALGKDMLNVMKVSALALANITTGPFKEKMDLVKAAFDSTNYEDLLKIENEIAEKAKTLKAYNSTMEPEKQTKENDIADVVNKEYGTTDTKAIKTFKNMTSVLHTALNAVGNFLKDIISTEEMANKLAVMRTLMDMELPPELVAMFVRRAGTPPFLFGGVWKNIINAYLYLANVRWQGVYARWWALKNMPKTAITKTLKVSLFPYYGFNALRSTLELALNHSVMLTADKDLKDKYNMSVADEFINNISIVEYELMGIPDIHKYNALVFPLGITAEGKVIALKFPVDDETAKIAHIFSVFGKEGPLNALSLVPILLKGQIQPNPALDTLADYYRMTIGDKYGSFGDVIPDARLQKLKEEGKPLPLLLWMFQRTAFNFMKPTLGNVEQYFNPAARKKTGIEWFDNIMKIPVISGMLSRFIVITDEGFKEAALRKAMENKEFQELVREKIQQSYNRSQAIKEIVMSIKNDEPYIKFNKDGTLDKKNLDKLISFMDILCRPQSRNEIFMQLTTAGKVFKGLKNKMLNAEEAIYIMYYLSSKYPELLNAKEFAENLKNKAYQNDFKEFYEYNSR